MKTSKLLFSVAAFMTVAGFIGGAGLHIYYRMQGMSSEQVFAGNGLFLQIGIGGMIPLGLFVALPLGLWFAQKEKGLNKVTQGIGEELAEPK